MRTFQEILSELGSKLDESLKTGSIVTPSVVQPTFNLGKTIIGTAYIEGKNYDLLVNKSASSSYLYQTGNLGENPIGRTKKFLDQSFVTLIINKGSILQEISGQSEQEGGFWYNAAAPKIV